jgi:hypothetical protein
MIWAVEWTPEMRQENRDGRFFETAKDKLVKWLLSLATFRGDIISDRVIDINEARKIMKERLSSEGMDLEEGEGGILYFKRTRALFNSLSPFALIYSGKLEFSDAGEKVKITFCVSIVGMYVAALILVILVVLVQVVGHVTSGVRTQLPLPQLLIGLLILMCANYILLRVRMPSWVRRALGRVS